MFGVDDVENQPLADAYGIVMGTSHTGTSPSTTGGTKTNERVFRTHDARAK